MGAKVQQEPNRQRSNKNRSACLFQIILDLLPHIDGHRPGIGQLILRQFDHQVIDALFPIQKVDDGGHHNGNHNANQVHGISHQHGVVSKKHLGEQDVDGQPGVAAHKWRYQHDLEAVPLAFQRTGSHDGGNRTAKSQQHGNEGFAGKPQLAHDALHHIGHTGHITAVLQ